MKKLFLCSFAIILAFAFCVTGTAQNIYQLQPLSTFGSHGDGSIRSGESIFDSGSNQRGMAYDPVLTNLVIVDTHSGAGFSDHPVGHIYVRDALTGSTVGELNQSTIGTVAGNQAYPYAAAAVADDGVVYVCNQVADPPATPFIIYRWASTVDPNPPTIAFSNNIVPAHRYGTSIAIRGSGAGTQILIGALAGTNVVMFTTADGMNFTTNVLTCDGAGSSFDDGLAFGVGNTFWGKQVSQSTYSILGCFAFNLAAHTATLFKSFPAAVFPDNDNLGPIAVNTNLNLLAALEENGGNISGGPDRVRLYDISNFSNQPPALLDVKTFTPDNNNTIAPMGYMNFVGTNLYVQNINNGMLAFGLGLAAPPPPTLTIVPAATNQAVVGRTVTLTVAGFPAVSYQWYSNNAAFPSVSNAIPGATSGTLSLVNVQNSYDQALYTCVVTNVSGITNASSRVVIVTAANFYHLALQWQAFPVGVAAGTPDDPNHPYIFNGNGGTAGTPNLRSIAYNPLSNHLYAITRSGFGAGPAFSNYTFYAIDAANGNALWTMQTNGITLGIGNGGVGLASVTVADDGAIYACNVAPQSGGGATYDATRIFRLYRWADGNSNTVPVQIYTGDPAINAVRAGSSAINRWGDSLSVRGSGLNTQIILDNNNADARYVAILTPTDSSMTVWNTSCVVQGSTGTTIGRSLEYGSGGLTRSGTFWQKRNATALIQAPFDLDAPIDAPPPLVKSTAFTNSLSGGTVDTTRHILMGVSTYTASTVTPDTLDMYEVSDFNNPLLLAQYNFPVNFGTNHFGNSANCINKTIRNGDKVFTLDSGNGLMAFKILPGAPTPPQFLAQPQDVRVFQGGTVSFTVAVDQQSAFQWRFNSNNIAGATGQNFTFTNAQPSNAGPYNVVASNLFGVSTSAVANVTVVSPPDEYSLSQIWNIPPTNAAGSIIIGTGNQTPNARTIAYNALSNHLYVVSRTSNTSSNYVVYILDAANGTILGSLNTNGLYRAGAVGEAGIGLVGIGVADDGAIYACNMATDACGCSTNIDSVTNSSSDALFRVYRWTNESATLTQVFSGDPAGQTTPVRWGDTMAVRGSGLNTEILLDTHPAGGYGAVLRPLDAFMNTFTNDQWFTNTSVGANIGRSLQFGSTNTMWQKRENSPLRILRYDGTNHTNVLVASYANFASTIGPIAQDFTRKIGVAIDFKGVINTSPDTVDLYDLSNPSFPLQLGQYAFSTNKQANSDFIGQVVVDGNRAWALDANNGLMAFTIQAPQLTISPSGSNLVISWTTNNAGVLLQATPDLTPPVTWTNAGSGTIVGDHYFLTNSSPAANLFYRLKN
jgi:hypothetical protein